MTFEGLGEMIEGYSADTCTGKFPLVLMGGRAEGLMCADPGARTPINASGNFSDYFSIFFRFGGFQLVLLASSIAFREVYTNQLN